MHEKYAIQLTAEEESLLANIDFALDFDRVRKTLAAADQLMRALLKRRAIPSIRIRYFTDPDLNTGPIKGSREGLFERNGVLGEAIYSNPHFLKCLRYFIFGPDLPKEIIEAFEKRVKESGGFVSGSDHPDLAHIARQAVRTHHLDPSDAADAFFQLGLELGLEPQTAIFFRDAARRVRT